MLKNEIKVGGLYLAKVSGAITTVRVDAIRTDSYARFANSTVYDVTNLRTGRKTTFRSAAKFRGEAKPPQVHPQDAGKADFDLRVQEAIETSPQAEEASEEADPIQESAQSAVSLPATVSATTPALSAGATAATAPVPTTDRTSLVVPMPPCTVSWDGVSLGTLGADGVTPSKAGSTSLAARIATTRPTRVPGTPVAGMVPNAEQEEILVAAVQDGLRALVIAAGAGTGKTATLKMLEQILQGRGQYTAFNASLVAESKAKFVKASCNTTHSLAFRAVGKLYQHRLGGERMRSSQVARILGVESFPVVLRGQGPPEDCQLCERVGRMGAEPCPSCGGNGTVPSDKTKVLQADYLAGQVLVAIRRFCQSADREIGSEHLRYIDGIDVAETSESHGMGFDRGQRSRENNDRVREYLLPFCRKAWDDLSRVDGTLPFSHDCYVKLWQLGQGQDRPIIAADYILLDEAQDTAPVFLSILQQQTHALLVFVGDSNQCQPTGTMVTVVKHYRRGNRFTGHTPTTYQQVPIEDIQVGDKVASYSIASSFLRRTGCEVKAVAVHQFDGELVVATVDEGSSAYTPNHKCVVRVGDALNSKWIVYLMRRGTSYRVGMVRGMYETQHGDIGLPMRMRAEQADAAWVLDICDTEEEARLREGCTAWGHGIPTLRFQQGMRYGVTQETLDEFWSVMGDMTERATALLGKYKRDIRYPFCTPEKTVYRNRGQVMYACNLIDGMLMLSMTGAQSAEGKRAVKNCWSPIKVSHRHYNGDVYSLSVNYDETYVADGIITHNSIYEWRGAVDAMRAYPDAERRLLTQSYRFGQAVADLANAVLATLDEPTDLVMRGNPAIPSRVAEVTSPRCYLYRTNAGAVGRVMGAIVEGKKPHLIGGGADVVAWCQAAIDLQAGRGTRHPELACFESWNEVVEYSKTDEGSDLKLMVKLVTDFGAEEIRDALRDMPKEEDADLVVSTAHKSKGREWDTVRLGGDFPLANKMGDADRRLLYVAATRAKLVLDISECPPFCGGSDTRDTGNAETSGDRVPGLEIRYTQPMPSPDDLAAYTAARTAGEAPGSPVAARSDAASAAASTPAPSVPTANGNGATGEFTWAKMDGEWCVRGPKDRAGQQVRVVRKNGTSSVATLGKVTRKIGDFWFYKV